MLEKATPQNLYRDIPELIEACYRCLKANQMTGVKWGIPYHFYRPSLTKYSASQWLWDSGWHIVAWSHRQPENAVAELRSLLSFQQAGGFIPQIIFWGAGRCSQMLRSLFLGSPYGKYTKLTQMPMLAYSLRALWQATEDRELLREFVPRLVSYMEWWQSRDHDGDGLVSIIHPWESGMDASPAYDPVFGLYSPRWYQLYPRFFNLLRIYRKLDWNEHKILQGEWFNVEDVGLCSVYADGWGVLASLANEFDTRLADRCREQSKIYQDAVITKCWNEGRGQFVSFYNRDGQEKELPAETVQTLLPILLDDLPEDVQRKLVSRITDPEKFGLPYPVPSVAKSEVTFNPQQSRLLWRGPTWPATNWLVMEGLLKHGFRKEAEAIFNKWLDMYLRYGIYEYYNPISGRGLGQRCLGMSTVIVDMWQRLKAD